MNFHSNMLLAKGKLHTNLPFGSPQEEGRRYRAEDWVLGHQRRHVHATSRQTHVLYLLQRMSAPKIFQLTTMLSSACRVSYLLTVIFELMIRYHPPPLAVRAGRAGQSAPWTRPEDCDATVPDAYPDVYCIMWPRGDNSGVEAV